MRDILAILFVCVLLVACNRHEPAPTAEAPTMTPEEYGQVMAQERQKADEWFAALSAAQPSAPLVVEFLSLFPDAVVRFRYFTATGEPGFDVNVDLHERYELTMQLPVVFDSSRSNVSGYGDPSFFLWEAASVQRGKSGSVQTIFNPAGARKFGSTEWKRIVERGGDFGAISYAMITNRPVAGFRDRKIQP